MNFEDQPHRGFGKFTSGAARRRFIIGLIEVEIVLVAFFIQKHEKESVFDPVKLVN
jgi:hypothetical protein